MQPGDMQPQLIECASEFLEGISTVDEQMLILLNPDDLVARTLSPSPVSNEAA